jgi:hypothetical protein
LNEIQKMIDYGGYITARRIAELFGEKAGAFGITRSVLSYLEGEKLVERIKPLCQMSVGDIVHVTRKACMLCNRKESHAWRAHSPSYISRALMLSNFLISIEENGCRIISSQADKIAFLMGKGFEGRHIPCRKLGKKKILRIDEHLVCGEPFSHPDGFCVVYPDKCGFMAVTQLKTLFKRYRQMLLSRRCPVRFLIVCQDSSRANEFSLAGRKLTGNGRGTVGGLGGAPLLLPVLAYNWETVLPSSIQ